MLTKSEKGLTLLEMIIALAIIGIICVSCLPAFTSGVLSIDKAGDTDVSRFNTQAKVEEALNVRNTDVTASGLDITLPDSSIINCPGEIESKSDQMGNGNQVTIQYFNPTY